MEYRLPMPRYSINPVADAEEEALRAMQQASVPTAPQQPMLPRTRKKSAGGSVTNNVKPEDELGTGRGNLARALQMYSQQPDVTALNEFAQQRMREGDSSMLNALAAQFAGSDFEPVQGVLLKRAMAAQEPQKVGNYGLISGGRFVADPYAARDTQANAMMDIGGELFRDERATEREDRRDARFFAQQERLARQAAARQGGNQQSGIPKVDPSGMVMPPSIIEPGVEGDEAVGLYGKWMNFWGKAGDVFGISSADSPNRVASERIDALANMATIDMQDAVPGRPSNFLLEMLGKNVLRPNEILTGTAGAQAKVQATISILNRGLADYSDILNNQEIYPNDDVIKAWRVYRRLSDLKSNYQQLLGSLQNNAGPAQPAASQPAASGGFGEPPPGAVRRREQ